MIKDFNPKIRRIAILNYLLLFVEGVAGLILVASFLNKLGAEVYGLWASIVALAGLLGILESGIPTIISQKIALQFSELSTNDLYKKFNTGLLYCILSSIVALFFGIIFIILLPNIYSEINSSEIFFFQLGAFLLVLSAIFVFFFNLMDAVSNSIGFPEIPKLSTLGGSLISLVASLSLLSTEYYLLAVPAYPFLKHLISFVLPSIFLVIFCIKEQIKFTKFDIKLFKELVKITPSIMSSKFFNNLTSSLENTLILKFVNSETVAIYSITKRFFEIIKLLTERILGIFLAKTANKVGQLGLKDFKYFILRYLKNYMSSVLILLVFVVIFNKTFISIWVGDEYYGGLALSILIAISLMTLMLSNALSYYLSVMNKYIYAATLVSIEGIMKVLFSLVLGYYFGLEGLIIGTTVASMPVIYMLVKKWHKLLSS